MKNKTLLFSLFVFLVLAGTFVFATEPVEARKPVPTPTTAIGYAYYSHVDYGFGVPLEREVVVDNWRRYQVDGVVTFSDGVFVPAPTTGDALISVSGTCEFVYEVTRATLTLERNDGVYIDDVDLLYDGTGRGFSFTTQFYATAFRLKIWQTSATGNRIKCHVVVHEIK